MLAPKSKLSVRAAVMSCLARCSEGEAPLCGLGEFLEKLSEMGWNNEDIQTVQISVLRLLRNPAQRQPADASQATLGSR